MAATQAYTTPWYSLRARSRPSSTDSVRRPDSTSFSTSQVLFVNMMSPTPRMVGTAHKSARRSNVPESAW